MKRHRTDSWMAGAGVMLVLTLDAAGAVPSGSIQTSALSVVPERPRVLVDTHSAPPGGRTIPVRGGGDLQAALNAALPGDVIMLEAGATFRGPFVLPRKNGEGWIVVRSAAADASLPPEGTRMTPAYAGVLPKIIAPGRNEPALRTAPGSHHFRFVGIEFKKAAPAAHTDVLLELGDGSRAQNEPGRVPHHLIFDRVYVHGESSSGVKHCIVLNSAWTAVIESYVSNCTIEGFDSQAIVGWNGPGPFRIVNNYLEGAGENVMFGGGDPTIPNLVPSDIEVRRNYFHKPLSWKAGDPGYGGAPWTVKTLLELKNAQRVLVDGNIFEHSWPDGQAGFAVQLTPRNQSGTAPWSVVRDVTFTNNIVRHTANGINILGQDDAFPSQQTQNIFIHNNLFDDVGGAQWGGHGVLFQILRGPVNLAVRNNTAFHRGSFIVADGRPSGKNFVFADNIVQVNLYGIAGSGAGVGLPALNAYFSGHRFEKNVIAGPWPSAGGAVTSMFPPDTFFPRSIQDVGFANLPGGDYRLGADSPFKRAGTGGRDIGADIEAVARATAGVLDRGPSMMRN